jgi:nickel/cobalt transporter (NicO) family protein
MEIIRRLLALAVLLGGMWAWSGPVTAGNPFTSKAAPRPESPAPVIKSRFFVKIVQWQHHLKQRMSALVREAKAGHRWTPPILLAMLALLYGAIHAAGPGHGKFVAISYMASRNAAVKGGLLFAVFIASVHGASGAVGVLGLRWVIQRGVGETLASVTTTTQIVSFGLIVLLGAVLAAKNGRELAVETRGAGEPARTPPNRFGVLPWAVAIGVVPCPAVVMTMLFCMSMDAMGLGLILAACISLGMAVTLSAVTTATVLGKTGVLALFPERKLKRVEATIGLLSGAAIAVFGALFLTTTLMFRV